MNSHNYSMLVGGVKIKNDDVASLQGAAAWAPLCS